MIESIEDVRNDLGSQFVCGLMIWTPKHSWVDVHCWIDVEGWLWVRYVGISDKRVVDCSGDTQDLHQRIAMSFSNVISKSVPVLRGDDKIVIAIILHRVEIEAPECLDIIQHN